MQVLTVLSSQPSRPAISWYFSSWKRQRSRISLFSSGNCWSARCNSSTSCCSTAESVGNRREHFWLEGPLARKLPKMVDAGVARNLVNPGAEGRPGAVALAVFEDAKEDLLDQVFT